MAAITSDDANGYSTFCDPHLTRFVFFPNCLSTHYETSIGNNTSWHSRCHLPEFEHLRPLRVTPDRIPILLRL